MDEDRGFQTLQSELDSYVLFFKRRCVEPASPKTPATVSPL